RLNEAIDLLAEAGSWEGVIAAMRDAATSLSGFASVEFGRWFRMLPHRWRDHRVAQLAAGTELRPRDPMGSIPYFDAAMNGFRESGDVDGEVASVAGLGMLLWWANDLPRLLALHQRTEQLAAGGSELARFMAHVGRAAIAHLMGDSASVFAALAPVQDIGIPTWTPV